MAVTRVLVDDFWVRCRSVDGSDEADCPKYVGDSGFRVGCGAACYIRVGARSTRSMARAASVAAAIIAAAAA